MPIYVSKGGGGGGADADAIHDNVAGEIAAVAAKGAPDGNDLVLIEDSADANNKKRVTISTMPATDPYAIHDNVAGEISAIAEKTTPVAADMILIEDSAAANAKKMVQLSNFPLRDVSVLCANATAVQSIPNNTETALTFDNEIYDTDTMHDISTNTNRLVAPVTGKYLVYLGVSWAANTAGYRNIRIRNSGGVTQTFSYQPVDAGVGAAAHVIVRPLTLAAAGWVDASVIQTSGGNLNVNKNQWYTFFGMHLIGEV